MQELDRYLGFKIEMGGPVHRSHTAAGEASDQSILSSDDLIGPWGQGKRMLSEARTNR
jgi:hypothetical protein